MKLAQIWRYPVKSMAGERLASTWVGALGIPGDRVVHVEDARGKTVTSRSRPRLLLHRGVLGPDGEPRVDGRPWASEEVARDLVAATGDPSARLLRDDSADRFDVLPLLVATDGAIAALGYDGRRLRPNLVVAGVDGLAEQSWPGRTLQIGELVVEAVKPRQRCIMTTFDPDTIVQDVEVLKKIHREFDGALALDCRVVQPGRIEIGQSVLVR